jgi:hypothetical protein
MEAAADEWDNDTEDDTDDAGDGLGVIGNLPWCAGGMTLREMAAQGHETPLQRTLRRR